MTKVRIIRVKSCGECPYRQMHYDGHFCGHADIVILGHPYTYSIEINEFRQSGQFPSWCPLEKEGAKEKQ